MMDDGRSPESPAPRPPEVLGGNVMEWMWALCFALMPLPLWFPLRSQKSCPLPFSPLSSLLCLPSSPLLSSLLLSLSLGSHPFKGDGKQLMQQRRQLVQSGSHPRQKQCENFLEHSTCENTSLPRTKLTPDNTRQLPHFNGRSLCAATGNSKRQNAK